MITLAAIFGAAWIGGSASPVNLRRETTGHVGPVSTSAAALARAPFLPPRGDLNGGGGGSLPVVVAARRGSAVWTEVEGVGGNGFSPPALVALAKAVPDAPVAVLGETPLLESGVIGKGEPAPGDGCWLSTQTCVYQAKKIVALSYDLEKSQRAFWIGVGAAVAAGFAAGWLVERAVYH